MCKWEMCFLCQWFMRLIIHVGYIFDMILKLLQVAINEVYGDVYCS